MSPRTKVRGEAGYTPNAFDFCLCGGTFVAIPRDESGKRACPWCGTLEGRRMTHEDRVAALKASRAPQDAPSAAEALSERPRVEAP